MYIPLFSANVFHIKKSKNDVEAVKISAETEIKKIREESDKELKKFKKKQMSKLD